jgi:hypothetical protein
MAKYDPAGQIDNALPFSISRHRCLCFFHWGHLYANFCGANIDLFDLENPLPPYTWYTEAYYGKDGKPFIDGIPPVNPAIKMCIHNYAWAGYPVVFFAEQVPTLVVGEEQAQLMRDDPQNVYYMDHAVVTPSLTKAMHFARRATGTDHVLVFDGAAGGINVSPSLAELLTANVPRVAERVDEELLPRWLRQRGLEVVEAAGAQLPPVA